MAFCLAELHLWSTKSSLQIQDTDIGTYQYCNKEKPANTQEHHYFNEKVHFTEARGYLWTPANRRPERLRDSLKELEELLQTNTCVQTRWRNTYCCQLLLSSGILVTLTLNGPQLDQVCIDRVLVGRLPGDTVTEAVLGDGLLVLSFLKQSQLAVIFLNKKDRDHTYETGRDIEKISPSTIKVTSVEVPGWAHRFHQGLALNLMQDLALCWWRSSDHDEGLWPWTSKNAHGNNLVLLSCSSLESLKVLSSMQTEGNFLVCTFSHFQPYQLLTVEAPAGPQNSRGASWAKACVYDYAKGRLQRTSAIRITLPSAPICCVHHPGETMLLLRLADSSLVLYDHRRGVTLRASCPAPTLLLAWHPSGAFVAVAGPSELIFLDVTLVPIKVAPLAEEVSPAAVLQLGRHLVCPGSLQIIQWAAGPDRGTNEVDTLMLAFHGGPLGILKIQLVDLWMPTKVSECLALGGHSISAPGGQNTPAFPLPPLPAGFPSRDRLGLVPLLQQRLRLCQVQEALGILEAMDWSSTPQQCWRGLSAILNHLLKLPLDTQTEEQIEGAFATFYTPLAPHPDSVMADYNEAVHKYMRRFFHHLVRHDHLEKAFLLAMELQDKDLFMDLHYVAGDKGEMVLAEVAKRKAQQVTEVCSEKEIITVINRRDDEGGKEDE